MGTFHELIDLDSYPITDPGSPSYAALLQRCREQFDDAVCCHLPGFLRPEAVAPMVAEIDRKTATANLYSVFRGAYNREDPRSAAHMVSLGDDDPRARPQRRHQLWLGADDFSTESALTRMYEWPALTRFVRDVLGVSELHTIDDPLLRILVNIHREGDELGWHVDSHDFAVTLLLRPALDGGLYQYVPQSGPGDENFPYCARLFDGDESRVRTVPMAVGSMVIFRGRNTIHRVTPARGQINRALALFSYEPVPGRVYGTSFRMNLLGRAEPRSHDEAA